MHGASVVLSLLRSAAMHSFLSSALWSGRALSRALACACALSLPATVAAQSADGESASTPEWGYADMQLHPETLRQRAEQGDSTAAYLLGTRYASGRGGFRDDSRAFEWFLKAAEMGMPDAQYNVAVMYATGRAVPRDMGKALEWLRAAATEGLPQAAADLGLVYMLGRGVERNPREALKWLEMAANEGNAVAQYHLALLYERERGVGLNRARAMAWYERAAKIGYEPAVKKLAALRAQESVGGSGQASAAVKGAPSSASASTGRGPASRDNRLPPGEFTIQLASHTVRETAVAAVRRLGLGRSARVVAVTSKGKPWFVILYGAYPDRDAASRAVKDLPKKLRSDGVWIRRVADIAPTLRG